ncbi:MAG: ATP-dependent helicase [Acidiferrobacter sp.]
MDDRDLLAHLNPEQITAVRHETGSLMILAGAGAGKTAVMTRRAARLVHLGHAPSRLMIVTFTNKAAREIKERCHALLGDAASQMAAGTFHGLILRHILRPADRQGLLKSMGFARAVSILDKKESDTLWKGAWKALNPEAYQHLAFVGFDLKKSRHTIGLLRAQGVDLSPETSRADSFFGLTSDEQNVERALRTFLTHKRLSPDPAHTAPLLLAVWSAYHQSCRSLNAIDFDDILTLGARVLAQYPDFAQTRAGLFSHIEVDEYQDTNPVQNGILDILAAHHGNLAVCGDDRQAIYGFRGSDIRMIRAFRDRYPQATIVDLIRNYRSTPAIVDAANDCARAMPNRLSTSDMIAEKIAGGPFLPTANYFTDDDEEAHHVCAEIQKIRDDGADWRTMAILYRQKAVKTKLEDALVRHRIPYAVVNDMGFFDHKDVAYMVGIVRVLLDRDDHLGWKRILSAGGFGVSAKALADATDQSVGTWATLSRLVAARGDKTAKIRAFMYLVERFSEQPSPGDLDVARLTTGFPWTNAPPQDFPEYLLALWTHTLLPPLRAEKEQALTRRFKTNPGGMARKQELLEDDLTQCWERVQLVAELVEGLRQKAGSWSDVLDDLSLQTDVHDDDKDVVRLMTIHASKGLEFDRVWYLGGADQNADEVYRRSAEELEEERRVFYVAITRARLGLTMTGAETRFLYGQPRMRVPSPFFGEVVALFQTAMRAIGQALTSTD